MSLRATFLVLLFANLAFLGWAELIDVPPEPPPSDTISQLPQLKLLSEVKGKSVAPGAATQGLPSNSTSASSSGAPGAVGTGTVPTPGATLGGGDASSGGAASRSSAAPESGTASSSSTAHDYTDHAAQSGTTTHTVAFEPPRDRTAVTTSHRCVAIGPFAQSASVGEASDLLRERGFSPRQRTAPSGLPRGYWVFIGGLKSVSDQAHVVQRLERNGISDAKAMPAADTERRVSVGLFTAREGAERRARAVRRLGFDAVIEPRRSAVVSWLDVDLDASSQSLPAEGLLALEESGSRLEIKECPMPEPSQGSPGAPGGAGSKALAKPGSPASAPDFNPQIPKPLAVQGRPRPG